MVTPVKAIRAKCLDCSCGSPNEVKLCPVTNCPLYPFRFGKNPNLQKERTLAQLEALKNGRVTFGSVDNHSVFLESSPTEGNYTPSIKTAETPHSAE